MLIISLIFTVLISLTMIGFGYMLSKKTPKGINSLIGYRSPMSTKNLDTWKFANEYSGRFWIKSGFITAAVSNNSCFCASAHKYLPEAYVCDDICPNSRTAFGYTFYRNCS